MADGLWQQSGANEHHDAEEPRHEKLVPGFAMPQHSGLPCGTGLGKYRILERIWTSHNAIAYKARDVMLDRLVSVKQMSPALIDNPIACGHFKREAQFLARLPKDAPHVTRIHELIEEERGLFIVEEYVPGPRLETLVAKRHTDLSRIVRLLQSAAEGLAVLHQTSIVHRDLNPSNLIVTEEGDVVITNLASAAHEGDFTQPPAITPKYTAPELLLGKDYDDRVDIYSLGMIIYEVCVGRHDLQSKLFPLATEEKPTVGHWVRWQTNHDARLPDAFQLNSLVPPKLSSILRRMTAKNLNERYTSVKEILADLEPQREQGSHLLALRSPTQLGQAASAWPLANQNVRYQIQQSMRAMPWATSESMLAPLRPIQSTSTHTVGESRTPPPPSTAHRRRQSVLPPTRAEVVQRSDLKPVQPIQNIGPAPRPTLPPPLSRQEQLRRFAPPRQRALTGPRPEAIPKPRPADEKHKDRRPRVLVWAAIIGLFVSIIGVGGGIAWYYRAGPGLQHPIENIFAEGMAAYESGKLDEAKASFSQATGLHVEHQKFRYTQSCASNMLKLIEVNKDIADGNLAAAEALLAEAKKEGINLAQANDLRQKIQLRRNASRLGREIDELRAKGHLIEAEAKLEAYQAQAKAAGLDASPLVHEIENSRQIENHNESLALAKAELEAGNWEKAMRSIKDAERIRSTSEGRDLYRKIEDAKRRSELILRGNQALQEEKYQEAVEAFEQANLIDPTPEVEEKVRLANANLLYTKAVDLIEDGKLLKAEQTLRSSLWQSKTLQAETRLDKMTPAFDAARLVRRADELMQKGQYAEAVRLYEEALPNLPVPASDVAQSKLARAKTAATRAGR